MVYVIDVADDFIWDASKMRRYYRVRIDENHLAVYPYPSQRAELIVENDNPKAIRFYQKLGFTTLLRNIAREGIRL